jgi:hypothetical protein
MSSAYGMVRLDFRLHRFLRHSWVSDDARAVWAPRVRRIQDAWAEILRQSVLHGVRRCAILHVPAREILPLEAFLAPRGFALRTLDSREEGGVSLEDQVAVGAPADVAALREAWGRDVQEVGRLLGYPACCLAFYERVIVNEAHVDPTWCMASGEQADRTGELTLTLDGPPETNPLLRWLGVQATPHVPCGARCAASVELSRRLKALGRELGLTEAIDWLDGMLSWPAEWSALHGIAEIKTPVVKTVATTDATAYRYVVRYPGVAYPDEAPSGLHFPFEPPARRGLVTLRVRGTRA